jgi:hypothetical protein
VIEGIERVDLLAMIEADGVRLRPVSTRAGEYAGPCPLCSGSERDDRLHVLTKTRAGKQEWFCRKCRTTPKPESRKMGDAMDYVRIVHGLAGAEAWNMLRRYGLPGDGTMKPNVTSTPTRPAVVRSDAGIILPEDGRLPDPPADAWQDEVDRLIWGTAYPALRADSAEARVARAYLEGRRLLPETVDRFALGFLPASVTTGRMGWRAATAGAIVIPWRYDGSWWRVQYRAVGDVEKSQRFRQKAGHGDGPRPAFNADAIDKKTTAVVVCEGEMDCMLLAQHAPADVAVVTWGSASIAPNVWAVDMLEERRVLLAFDGDEAGSAAAVAWSRLGRRVDLPAGKDVTEFAQQGGDVGAWLRTVLGDDSDQWDEAVLEALRRAGWSASFKHDAGFTAIREVVA